MVTRPDIQFAMNVLRRHQNCFDDTHWEAGKSVLKYLKSTSKFGLVYEKDEKNSLELVAYVDADFAGDVHDRKSTTGYFVFLGKGLVSWSSRKQKVVAQSTCEAEFLALSEVVNEEAELD